MELNDAGVLPNLVGALDGGQPARLGLEKDHCRAAGRGGPLGERL
ncbi:hypothetical protein [Streptomyces sp. NPDC003697]